MEKKVTLEDCFDDLHGQYPDSDITNYDDNSNISYNTTYEFEVASHGNDLIHDSYMDVDELTDLG